MFAICALIRLALAALPSTQPPSAGPPIVTASGAFFAMSVPDLQASSRWYSEKLGLHVVMQLPKRDKVAVVVLEGAGFIVELVQKDDAVPLRQAAPRVEDNTLVHGIFKAGAVVADFDRTIEALRQRGVEVAYGPYPARSDQRANVIIRDNAGNLIQLFGQYASRR
ncbi:MAG TPA: VOC family protein [Vicinamibacterales bacterium]|jgi:catechol 2,3-dioxygenase-like lactoylglutathione lyase family enzyme